MIVKIQVRDSAGAFRYRDANIGEFAEVSLREILSDGKNGGGDDRTDGWWWLRQWLCWLLLDQVKKHAGDPIKADKWYGRYRAIRGVE